MDQLDQLATALDRLCTKEGGWKVVARKLDVNDQSLYQITTGKRLPSGNPKGVGPKLRSLLDEHYPGWRTLHTSPIGQPHVAQQPLLAVDAGAASPYSIHAKQPTTLTQVIEELGRHMRGLDPPLRNAIGALIAGMCSNPDTANTTAQTVQAMLSVQGNGAAQKSTNSQAA